MYNVIINNDIFLFLQNSFFYLRKIFFFERNFDIRLKTVRSSSSVEHKDKKIQSGLNCYNAGLHIA